MARQSSFLILKPESEMQTTYLSILFFSKTITQNRWRNYPLIPDLERSTGPTVSSNPGLFAHHVSILSIPRPQHTFIQ
ncbi:hypothetical protein H4Q26_005970 [Puccinia striiformis f. sp. tritici PST-130]|nr:hypothetical protein H4Q26_005970 [Puccinia striiformis f. sp. tritici PST-130]